MWKWILGIFLGLVVLAGLAVWWGYQRLQEFASKAGPATVVIAAAPERVFASLANADSLATWMSDGKRLTLPHHGMLVAGDTLHVERSTPDSSGMSVTTWIVTGVVPGRALTIELQGTRNGRTTRVASRQYALTSRGDSTLVTADMMSPMMDSLKNDTSKSAGKRSMTDFASKVMSSAFRMQGEFELKQLQARIEGRPAIDARVTIKP